MPVIEPRAERRTDFRAEALDGGIIRVQVAGQTFTVRSRFSTPKPEWVTGANDYFAHERKLEVGAEGVYWDEHEYSAYEYHYGEPWDSVSGEIDPKTLDVVRLKSSVTLLTESWRLKLAQRILDGHPLIGKERIITNRSGLFGWGDASEHEVHVFNADGVEVEDFSAPLLKRDGKTYTELRIAEDWSAAIVRRQP